MGTWHCTKNTTSANMAKLQCGDTTNKWCLQVHVHKYMHVYASVPESLTPPVEPPANLKMELWVTDWGKKKQSDDILEWAIYSHFIPALTNNRPIAN